jgi:hypothetical protein
VTEAERIARAQRADRAWSEFFEPMLAELRGAYSERLVEVANSELSRDKRADKITALANALKILEQVENGLQAAIMDGDVAANNVLRAEKMERMTAPERRLFGLVPTP